MSRNDGILYSGMASTTRTEQRQEQEDKKRELLEKRSALLPDAEFIFAEIEKIRNEIKLDKINLVKPESTDKEVKATILSLNLNDEFVNKFALRMRIILRARLPKEDTNE